MTIVFPISAVTNRINKIENEIISKQFPDGTAEQIKLTQLIFDCYSRVFWPI
jgi:hypothetical protein